MTGRYSPDPTSAIGPGVTSTATSTPRGCRAPRRRLRPARREVGRWPPSRPLRGCPSAGRPTPGRPWPASSRSCVAEAASALMHERDHGRALVGRGRREAGEDGAREPRRLRGRRPRRQRGGGRAARRRSGPWRVPQADPDPLPGPRGGRSRRLIDAPRFRPEPAAPTSARPSPCPTAAAAPSAAIRSSRSAIVSREPFGTTSSTPATRKVTALRPPPTPCRRQKVQNHRGVLVDTEDERRRQVGARSARAAGRRRSRTGCRACRPRGCRSAG